MARLDYFAPGVYIEEVNRGSRPIEGVSMSVAGFVGFTEAIRGKAKPFTPQLITSWEQYLENFAEPGSDGFTDFGAYLPFSIKGWFDNGGGRCWVVSLGTQLPHQPGKEPAPNDEAISLTVTTSSKRESLRFKRKDAQSQSKIVIEIAPDEPYQPENSDEEPFDTGEYFQLTVKTEGGESDNGSERKQEYRHLTMNPEPGETGTYVAEALRDAVDLDVEILAEEGLPLAMRPSDGRYEVSLPPVVYEEAKLHNHMYGMRKKRTGLQGLFEIDEVATIACPDLMMAYEKGYLDTQQVKGLMEMMITGCENASPNPPYRMVVLDPLPGQTPQEAADWLENWGRRSQFAALYYPWLEVPNPRNNGRPIAVPPCGHMMGVWCQTDETRGIHKAPANVTPRGVIDLSYDVNFREQEYLNPKGINCIRAFPGRGIKIWGARTLVETDDVQWRYISVRRLMSYIERSIQSGTQWAVFEPNDADLWARVTRTVRNFLERLWRSGALFGSTPDEAFYVKCDGELNTPETMKLGRLFIEVGICPVRPAEFVVFRISQWDPTQ
ncbi:phage tail sheath family protein [Baaleninema simplex]|uniref:phage tail sheath family protein n=1 Tax=Baaleninema simplex TaxID=2862350 RepID=UPI000345428F|nr:phage tail sheath C-terminal domain-containing protein [Baaleninema simplex]